MTPENQNTDQVARESIEANIKEAYAASRTVSIAEEPVEADIEAAYAKWQSAKKSLINFDVVAKQEAAKLAAIEARNAEIAKVQTLLDAHDANKAAQADKKADEPTKLAAKEAFDAARLAVENRMLPVHVSTPKAAKTADGTPKAAGTSGPSISEQVKTIAREMFANNATGAAVRAECIKVRGFNDGTANAAIVAVERELGLK
jgi:hypothetical protein